LKRRQKIAEKMRKWNKSSTGKIDINLAGHFLSAGNLKFTRVNLATALNRQHVPIICLVREVLARTQNSKGCTYLPILFHRLSDRELIAGIQALLLQPLSVGQFDGKRAGSGAIGPDLFRAACFMGLEGLVAKRSDRPYRGGRSPHWVKVKNRKHPAMMRVMEAFR
jgi:hypothetical protein